MTTPQIINIAKISEYLSSIAITRAGLFGGGTPNYLPSLIRSIRKNVEWTYERNPSDENLIGVANYLYALCSKWNKIAQAVTGGGGSVAPIIPISTDIYPFFISSADFESDGVSYSNSNIVGDNIALFVNQWTQQWWPPNAGFFVYTDTGIRVVVDGFNANDTEYTIMIQRVY